jgi:phage terminase large subunit
MTDIALPHNGWLPRHHQLPLWRYLRDGGRRAVAIWHRRAGKDEIALHHTAYSAMMRKGNYAYALPIYAQARKTIWESVNPHSGLRRIDEVFPESLRESTKEAEMFIRLVNGSTFQLIGSDTYDTSLVGTSYAGVVFSEYALANPSAWAYARPVLEENDGWALFISTPRGRNHCYDIYKYARQRPDWFCELLTAEDTRALTTAQLAEALAEMKALYGDDAGQGQYAQEYMCDFSAAFLLGAFYSSEMTRVRIEGRIQPIEPKPGEAVSRCWDLGIGDDTSIWYFSTPPGSQIMIYDHDAASGRGLEQWRDLIAKKYEDRGWNHGADYVPQDAKVRELGTGRTRVETMRSLGLRPMLVPNASIDDGINAVRRTLPLCVFHPRTEDGGLSALEQYRREWDDDKKAFRASAVHDWTSHPADSFRYLSLAWKPAPRKEHKPQQSSGWRIPPPRETPQRRGVRI